MTQWYIGIDETGSFNHLDPHDNSNVSAAVTKRSPQEIFKIFKTVAQKMCYKIKGNDKDKSNVLQHFHGCEQRDKFRDLNALLKEDDQLVDCVIQSKGRPFVTVNPQQWWIAAVLGVVQKFFTLRKCQKEDKVLIEIALRDDRSLGLRFVPKKEVFEQYNSQIASCIEKELKQTLKGKCQSIRVTLQAAGHSELSTLGDQVSNMIKEDYQAYAAENLHKNILKRIKPIEAFPFSASFGNNVKHLINKDNLQGAIETLLSELLKGHYDNIGLLNEIIQKAKDQPDCPRIWQTIISSCSSALWNRGIDGNAINHAGEIISRLTEFFNEIPDESLKNKFLHVYAEYMGCAGKWDSKLFEEIEQTFHSGDSSFSNPLKRWNFYLNIFSAKAQTFFNVYKFGELQKDYKQVQDVQNQIDALRFPFCKENDPDQNYSEIYGTIGQDLAFQGKYTDAIEYLEKDYQRSPASQKSMCASFLSVAYFKLGIYEKALEWHKKQCEPNRGKKDQWQMLDELRVGALATKNGINYDVPPINEWHNEGDYPWPLLLKWSAYVEYMKGKKLTAFQRLENAYKKLVHSPGFTIRTLALSVIAMQIYIAQDDNADQEIKLDQYRKNYEELLEKCKKESPSFGKYVERYDQFSIAAQKAESLWEAANLLPFNFA